ncbi:MAG: VWA domain-containing protein [Ilumatobacteraceae bacterium]
MRHRPLLLLVPVAAILLAACGSSTTATTTTPASSGGRGWIGGEPDFDEGSAGGGAMADSATREAAGAATTPAAPAPDVAPVQTAMRAGSVDDNADLAGYLDSLTRYDQLGLPSRTVDATGRIVVTATGANGLPAMGVPVTVAAGDAPVAALRTGVDGRVIFLPATFGDVRPSYHVSIDGAAGDAAPGTDVTLTSPADGGAAAGVPVDVLFLLDVTGSMGDEIDQLKTTIGDVADQLRDLPQHPDIRFGMTLFRDEGDAFVTSTFDLTGDIEAFQAALAQVEAGGGGDTPEAVDEAFAAALDEPSWRDPASTAEFVFLVGDAAPHVERAVQQPYPESIKVAQSRGITVHAIAASSTDDAAEHAFRAIAQGTGGRFVFLAYGAGGAAVGEHTDITPTDYEEMSLDALVVRLVAESLANLTGTDVAPPPTLTPTTIPRPNDQQQPTG